MLKALLVSTLALLIAQPLFGYVLEGFSWTLNRTVQVQLALGSQSPLMDGFASFNDSAADALQKWNSHMTSLTFLPLVDSPVVPVSGDGENSAAFSGTVFGDQFGAGVIAVTTIASRNGVTTESDTLFNRVYSWDSYTGPMQGTLLDFHRVALHEFGHMVGLDHPDQAGQTVSAIMNSQISDTYRLQPDDISGAQALYSKGPPVLLPNEGPILSNISTRAQVALKDKGLIGGFIVQGTEPATVVLRAIGPSLAAQGLTGVLPDPVLTVYDDNGVQIGENDDWISGPDAQEIASYHLDPPASTESALLMKLQPGAYTAVIASYSSAEEPAQDGIGLFELYDLHTTGGRAGNLSTRGQVLSDDDVLIGGFIIGGTEAKPIVVRALGPSLAATVSGSLPNPLLELHDSEGNLIQSNDNWGKGPDADMIEAEGLAPTNAKESAVQATLSPGNYTAIVKGVKDPSGSTGIGLVEVYDLSDAPQ